jgi:chromosome segregation ATPase
MASESTEEETLTVALPGELGEWLEAQAADQDVDRAELLVQVLSAYRATATLDGDEAAAVGAAFADAVDEDALVDRAARRVEARVEETAAAAAEDTIAEAYDVAPADVQADLEGRIDSLEAEVDEKIADVRERVVQVKRETDAKAPADHEHEAFETVEAIGRSVAELESRLGALAEDVGALEEGASDREERLDDVEERLRTVAWVVSDLREAFESRRNSGSVDRLKRAAAEADVSRAACENCGEGVEIGLLTEPNCPHCEATVTDVEPSRGWFGSPRLLVAAQLEAGGDG